MTANAPQTHLVYKNKTATDHLVCGGFFMDFFYREKDGLTCGENNAMIEKDNI